MSWRYTHKLMPALRKEVLVSYGPALAPAITIAYWNGTCWMSACAKFLVREVYAWMPLAEPAERSVNAQEDSLV